MTTAIQCVQLPLLAAMLLGGAIAKLARAARIGSFDTNVGPTQLFPLSLRTPLAIGLCAIEFGLGLGLVATAGSLGAGAPATCVRLGAALLFLVATSALIELRSADPEAGCGCFGDFSTAPVSGRTLARSALLAAAALSTLGLPPVHVPQTALQILELVLVAVIELGLLAALSPELGEGLIRLGYSEPCELRDVPTARTLALLRRSKAWRRQSGLVTSDVPADVWREVCWRYVVYPGSHEGRPADVVFAVFLQQRRPVIYAAIVDSMTGRTLPWPTPPAQSRRQRRLRAVRAPLRVAPGSAFGRSSAARTDMPFSNDLYR
jgi:hypothetical protein